MKSLRVDTHALQESLQSQLQSQLQDSFWKGFSGSLYGWLAWPFQGSLARSLWPALRRHL